MGAFPAMSLTPIDLCSRALLRVGANGITSFYDGTIEAEIAANLYPSVRDALLSAHPWNFAMKQTELVRLATPPAADFDSAFPLPADCLRVISAGTNGRGAGLVYKIAGRVLAANEDNIMLTYVSRAPESISPPFFDYLLITFLAAEFCIPLTESTSRWEALRKIADLELRRARLIDAQEETPSAIQDFSLVRDR